MSTKQLYSKRNDEIVKLWNIGMSREFISKSYGISRKQVRKIVNRNSK